MTIFPFGSCPVPALEFIPPRPPMALVKSLERAYGEGCIICTVIPAGTMFIREDATVEPLVLLEIIAQACAVYGGWRTKDDSQGKQAAFLAGVGSFEIVGKAVADEPMEITVTLLREFAGFHLFNGELRQGGYDVARASLKAYQPAATTTRLET